LTLSPQRSPAQNSLGPVRVERAPAA